MENEQEVSQDNVLNEQVLSSGEAENQKLFTQEDVNRLMAQQRAKVRSKFQGNEGGEGSSSSTPPVDVDAIANAVTQRTLEQIEARQKAYEQQQFEAEHAKNVEELRRRLNDGKSQYENFDEVVSTFNGSAYPAVISASMKFDNTAGLMYELAENPEKAARLQFMAEKGDYAGLERAMKKLSDSIAKNEEAKKTYKTSTPISKIKPGTGSTSSGNLSAQDYARIMAERYNI